MQTRNNKILVKLPKVKLETRRKRFYFLGAKVLNALSPEVRIIRFRTVFKKALDEHFESAYALFLVLFLL